MQTRVRMSAVVPLLVLTGLLVLLWAGQRRLMYLPSGLTLPPAAAGLPSAEPLDVRTPDGLVLGAWFVPAGRPEPAATIIVFNGNAGNRGDRAPLAQALAREGFATVLADYRGYGGNPGHPTEALLIADALALRAAVATRPSVDPGRLIYFGESLGSGVAVALAAVHPPAALVLRSPFTSIADVAAHHYWFLPARRLVWDRFDSYGRRGSVRCPTLIVAGDRDSVVPYALTQRLYEAWPEPKSLVTLRGADHNDFDLVAGPEVIAAVRAFADAHVAR